MIEYWEKKADENFAEYGRVMPKIPAPEEDDKTDEIPKTSEKSEEDSKEEKADGTSDEVSTEDGEEAEESTL